MNIAKIQVYLLLFLTSNEHLLRRKNPAASSEIYIFKFEENKVIKSINEIFIRPSF